MRWLLGVLTLVLMGVFAHARPGPQWEGQPANIRAWFENLMQPDHPQMSCCGEADAFEADDFESRSGTDFITVTITNGKGIIPNGTRIYVPQSKVKWSDGNPTGHGILFVGSSGMIYCYVMPGGV